MSKKLLLFSAYLFFLHSTLDAQLIFMPFDEIVQSAELIVEGEIKSSYCAWDEPKHCIYTIHELEVFRLFKGDLDAPTIKVVSYGGIVEDKMVQVSETAQFGVGHRGTFCLNPTPFQFKEKQRVWDCLGGGSPHGFFAYDAHRDAVYHPFFNTSGIQSDFYAKLLNATQLPIHVLQDVPFYHEAHDAPEGAAIPTISSFSPSSLPSGCGAGLTGSCSSTSSTLTINGANFETSGTVNFARPEGGTATADASDIVSWNANQIVVRVPSTTTTGGGAGTGTVIVTNASNQSNSTSPTLTVPWAYTNFTSSGTKYSGKLANDNGSGGLTFTLSTSLCSSDSQNVVNAFGRALKTWRCATSVNWVLSTSSTSSTAIASDGTNIVTFDISTPLTGNILARATSWYSGCGSPAQWSVTEIDINIDKERSWYYCDNASGIPGNKIDFETVALHELGHGHQLNHVNNTGSVMLPSVGSGTTNRTLGTNEMDGGDCIFGQNANTCGPSAMTALSGNCNTLTPPSSCSAAGSCTAALPVEWLSFDAHLEGDAAVLDWATGLEINNDFFAVQRSNDGVHYQTIGTVKAKSGPRNGKNDYQYTDYAPHKGQNYYRIQQHDFDGGIDRSIVRSLYYNAENQRITLAPNPSNAESVFVRFNGFDTDEVLEVQLFDLTGRLLVRYPMAEGSTLLEMPVSGLNSGVYHLSISGSNGYKATRRLLRL